MAQGSGPVPGWYPDPEVPGGQRYWDGAAWGEQVPPSGASWPQGGPPGGNQGSGDPWERGGQPGGGPWQGRGPDGAPSWQGGGPPPSWQGGGRPPAWQGGPNAVAVDSWLGQAIVATVIGLMCCFPAGLVGIPAILKANQSGQAAAAGDLTSAQVRAREARTWTLWTFAACAIVAVGFVLLWVLGAFAAFTFPSRMA